MEPDRRVVSPAHSGCHPGTQIEKTSVGHESGASRAGSGGSVRSYHSNLSGIALRTGRSKHMQEEERASTPMAVLPPIGRVSPDDIHQLTQSTDLGEEQYYSSSPVIDLPPGNGESVPRIARGFKRETSQPDQSTFTTASLPSTSIGTTDKPIKRVVSFVAQERKTPERREVILQSFETQTDWDWLEDAMLDESVKILEPRFSPASTNSDQTDGKQSIVKQESAESIVQSTSEAELEEEEKKDEEGPLPYPYSNDEFGVPLLDLSSDSEMSSDDEAEKPKLNDKLLPSVGPPQILQYNRESEQKTPVVAEPQIEDTSESLKDYPQDESGNVHGYFSGVCEFCGGEIRPFPTAEQQQQLLPEKLYCCEAYRNFIESVLNEEKATPTKTVIDVKPHAHYGSKKERKKAQQKAQLRMRERQLLRQQQQSVQSSSQQSSHYHTGSRQSRKASERNTPPFGREGNALHHQYGKQSKHSSLDHNERSPGYTLVGTPDLRGVPLITTTADGDQGLDVPDKAPAPLSTSIRDRTDQDLEQIFVADDRQPDHVTEKQRHLEVGPHVRKPHKMTSHANLLASMSSSSKDSDLDSVTTIKLEKKLTLEGVVKAMKKKTTDSSLTSSSEVARQMKTINYQLSSQRCLEEGWTVRPPSPLLQDEVEDIFIPEPLDPAFAALNKNRKRELIQKFYDDGTPYLTIFPDGSGNVFYHSGNVAIVVSCPEPGQYTFMVLEDDLGPPEPGEIHKVSKCVGVFGSNGHASCCYGNGKLRLFMDEYMGIELDRIGAKKRKWFWNDTETHVHAPPFQPVCFALTPHIAVRVMSQENMTLTFRCKNRSCRLPVGARLKLVNPENFPAKEVDSDYLFISEKKALTQTILNRISNLLHFPKSPKVEKMLPPLHITSRVHKNEMMQHQRDAAMAAAEAKKTKQRPIRPVVVS